MDSQPCGSQPIAEGGKVVHQGFTTSNDNDRGIDRFSFCNQVGSKALRMATSIPRMLGVAPGAPHVTSRQPNKKGICTRPDSLTLN
jgi:hypothetical protein